MLKKFCLLFFSLLPFVAFADEPIEFSYVPCCTDRAVSAVVQEDDASLWLSIDNNLCRFNGHTLETVVQGIKPEALSSNGNGRIYTVRRGSLIEIDIASLNVSTTSINAGNNPHLICNGDSLYFSVGYDLYLYFNGRSTAFLHSPSEITALGLSDGKICFGTADGAVYRSDNDSLCPVAAGNAPVTALFQRTDGNLIVGFSSGAIEGMKFSGKEAPSESIRCFCQDKADNLYIGAADGLFRISPEGECLRVPLTDKGRDPVRCLFSDGRGGILAGTYYNGLFYMNPERNACSLVSDKLKRVKGIVERRDGCILYFTDGYGIYKARRGETPVLIPGTDQLKIQSVYEDSDGTIWCGSFLSGLLQFNDVSGKIREIPFTDGEKNINCIVRHGGRLAIATNRGVYLFSPESEEAIGKRLEGASGNIFSLASHSDSLWIGSDGLYLSVEGAAAEKYAGSSENPLCGSECTALNIGKDGKELLVGTSGAGFCLLTEGEERWFRDFSPAAGSNFVATLQRDSLGNVIVGTSEGISILNIGSGHILNFTSNNCKGMGSIRGGCICPLSDGTFLAGGKEAVFNVRTDRLGPVEDTIDYYIDSIREEGSDMVGNRYRQTFSHNQNNILIELCSREYDAVPSKVFWCRLAPTEDKWRRVDVADGIEYRNLPPGRYTIIVRASRNGNAPYSELSRTFTVHPVWYATLAAKMLWVILILGSLARMGYEVWYRFTLKERIKTFIDISHKLRSPLTIALGEMEGFFSLHRDNFPGRGRIETSYRNALKMKDIIAEYVDLENVIDSEQEPLPHTESLVPLSSKAKKILVVDDNPEIRQLLHDMFDERFHILEAFNGNQAVQLARKHHPAIILSEVQIPGMDGIALCCTLKEDSETCQIPFILLTANASAKDKLSGIRAGADDYIIKPFSREILSERCDSLIRGRKALRDKYSIAPDVLNATVDEDVRDNLTGCIERHLTEPELDVNVVCRDFGISKTVLNTRTRKEFGMSPRELIEDIRLRHAANLLRESRKGVAQIAEELCFCSPKYFALRFKKKYGVSPQIYRTSGRN